MTTEALFCSLTFFILSVVKREDNTHWRKCILGRRQWNEVNKEFLNHKGAKPGKRQRRRPNRKTTEALSSNCIDWGSADSVRA